MENKNLLDLDLQIFSEEIEDAGENEVEESATLQEEEASESEETVETGETEEAGDAEPEQSAEENARYAAIRRRAEEDARRKVQSNVIDPLNQKIAAMCNGTTHPITGAPVTNVFEYFDALESQERIRREQELKEKGIDPSYIDRAIASNPTVLQAQRVLQEQQEAVATNEVLRDLAEIGKYDQSIKSMDDLAALPNFPEILDRVKRGANLVDAYKMVNFDTFMQHTNEAARQQAINQMRGKDHLTSNTKGVATENDDVEVPAEIMKSWKAEGKTEKQIRELYKTVAGKLHLN